MSAGCTKGINLSFSPYKCFKYPKLVTNDTFCKKTCARWGLGGKISGVKKKNLYSGAQAHWEGIESSKMLLDKLINRLSFFLLSKQEQHAVLWDSRNSLLGTLGSIFLASTLCAASVRSLVLGLVEIPSPTRVNNGCCTNWLVGL